MPYKINKALIKKLPVSEQGTPDEVGQRLLDKSGNICYLCGGELLPAKEVVLASEDPAHLSWRFGKGLSADHVKAKAEGGPDALGNFRLVHLPCNSAKGTNRPEDVIPYLHLKRYVQDKGGRVKYGDITALFQIEPSETQIDEDDGNLVFKFADGTSTASRILEEAVAGSILRYCFLQVPPIAIFNDGEVQPRDLRIEHVKSIFLDLAKNPLHEPPSCRLDPSDKGHLRRIRMFDGQHKTTANWLRGRDRVTIKLYIDMSPKSANELVTSIQAKIKKLSLSPFELAAKMSDEWKGRITIYVDEMKKLGKPASEQGFINWLPPGSERNQGKAALKNAVIQDVLDSSDFRFSEFVETPGISKHKSGLKEQMLKGRYLDKLLVTTPLSEEFDTTDIERHQAVMNVVWMSNIFLETLLDDSAGEIPAELLVEKRNRLFNQNTLDQVAELLRQVFVRTLNLEDGANLSVEPSQEQRDLMEERITRLASHPWWTAPWDRDEHMIQLREANRKNQDRKKSFNAIAFSLSFAMVGDDDSSYQDRWLSGPH